ncbi:phosphoadenosine phosphosulfate reductase [Halobacillus andaensis]|uniref:Adenosine 5'-phosphosulfate reductase n=1 Tax=Halobacillus andaensis TaxID=1176239 RepID=A0A917B5R5_HALAA|nr:phosphoadenylyl-sulfate reductase [Halobacillus andaensis]MBP2005787.1 phosphoadenosine phosphosulfate reductase [Halobacillus andaensis]GGF26059.1 phosphoadenosine phosphosulfate reductase [Halobacillus andaensis]
MTHEQITYESFVDDPFTDFQPHDQTKGALTILEWAYNSYDDIVYACSFGAEGIVLIDLISRVKKDAHIVFLDTDVHFQETYELIDRIKARFPDLQITMKKPKLTLQEQAEKHGDQLWNSNPDHCCYIRKIKPLEEALSGATAWVSGLRREQSLSRSKTDFVNKDERFRSVKICPLIHWTWEDVWNHIKENNLPYNDLHDRGYASIGCMPCTTPSDDPHDRSGRWEGFGKTECGLHTVSSQDNQS